MYVVTHVDKAEQTDPGFVEKLVTQIVKNVQVSMYYGHVLQIIVHVPRFSCISMLEGLNIILLICTRLYSTVTSLMLNISPLIR